MSDKAFWREYLHEGKHPVLDVSTAEVMARQAIEKEGAVRREWTKTLGGFAKERRDIHYGKDGGSRGKTKKWQKVKTFWMTPRKEMKPPTFSLDAVSE